MKKNLLSLTVISLLLLNSTAFAKTLNLACMKAATETRENTFVSAWNGYSSTVKFAKKNKRSQLKNVWDITNESQRKSAIKAIEKNYNDTVRNAEKQRRNSEKSAKKTFQTAAKNCRQ